MITFTMPKRLLIRIAVLGRKANKATENTIPAIATPRIFHVVESVPVASNT